jgi:hypothetical protein
LVVAIALGYRVAVLHVFFEGIREIVQCSQSRVWDLILGVQLPL